MQPYISQKELERIAKKFYESDIPHDKEHLLEKNYYIKVKDKSRILKYVISGIVLMSIGIGGFIYNRLSPAPLVPPFLLYLLIFFGFVVILMGIIGRWKRLKTINTFIELINNSADAAGLLSAVTDITADAVEQTIENLSDIDIADIILSLFDN